MLARYPTANVRQAPIVTYHVHGMRRANSSGSVPGFTKVLIQMYMFTQNPASMPHMAPRSVARLVSNPNRKTPSSAPYATDAIDNPTTITLWLRRETIASPNSSSAQPTVAMREMRSIDLSSFAPPLRRIQKSTIVLDDSEFSAALRFDIAAARIAATISPEIRCGIRVTINVGKIRSAPPNVAAGWP